MGIFDRFTERAQKVMVYSQEEAVRMNYNYIGTEHILLGILREGGNCRPVLKSKGIDLAAVRNQVEAIIGKGQQKVAQVIAILPEQRQFLN